MSMETGSVPVTLHVSDECMASLNAEMQKLDPPDKFPRLIGLVLEIWVQRIPEGDRERIRSEFERYQG